MAICKKGIFSPESVEEAVRSSPDPEAIEPSMVFLGMGLAARIRGICSKCITDSHFASRAVPGVLVLGCLEKALPRVECE
jgi:hypothetical protein